MKSYIYILLFLTLHSCRGFNLKTQFSDPFVSINENLIKEFCEKLVEDNSDNSGGSEKSKSGFRLVIDSEEREEQVSKTYVDCDTPYFIDGWILRHHNVYLLRNLPDKYIVPIYLFFGSLLI